jgi:hypothetical protein
VRLLSKKELACGELLIARAIHRTGEKFSMLDNPHWRTALAYLRPAFKVPGRDAIGERLLDNEYVAVQREVILAL